MENNKIKSLTGYAPFLLIVLGIGGILVGGLVISRWDYSIRGLSVAIPMIISAIFLRSLFSIPADLSSDKVMSPAFNFPLLKIFIVLYLVSVVILLLKLGREMYLVIIVLLFIILAIQILFSKFTINIILSEIILMMANIIYGITFYYPLYFRTTDTLLHINYATITRLSGHTIPLDLTSAYSPFPLYHILIAECSNIFNLSPQEALFLIVCPIFVLTVLFIYKILALLSGNPQAAVLGCLIFSAYHVVLGKGIEMVTSGTAFVGYCILVYLMIKIGGRRDQRHFFQGLALIISLFIILVHQVSIFLILALLVVFIISENVIGKTKIFTNYFMFLILAVFSGYWIYQASAFSREILISRLDPAVMNLAGKPSMLLDPVLNRNVLALFSLSDKIDISIMTTFAITAVFYMIWRQKPKYLAVLGVFLLITLPLYLPNPLSTYYLFSEVYRIDRFLILLLPFVAFAMGYGYIITYNLFIRKHYSKSLVASIYITIFAIFVVISVSGVVLTEESGTRYYFNDEELDGYSFVENNIPYGSDLNSDYFSVRYFNYKYFSLTDTLQLPYYNSEILEGFDGTSDQHGYFIIREEVFDEDGLWLEESGGQYIFLSTWDNTLRLKNYIENKDKVYYSDSITIGL